MMDRILPFFFPNFENSKADFQMRKGHGEEPDPSQGLPGRGAGECKDTARFSFMWNVILKTGHERRMASHLKNAATLRYTGHVAEGEAAML